jgi:hypothetical protein
MVTLTVRSALRPGDGDRTVSFRPRRLVVAGYTARDEASLRQHIDELAAQGVAPPRTVPAFYEVVLDRLAFSDVIAVDGAMTSGEVEPVLFCGSNEWYVGIASDHTDREIEREDVARSKEACPKVVSTDVLPFAEIEPTWDELRLRSFTGGSAAPYQHAPLSALRPVREVVDLLPRSNGDDLEGLILLLGTVPTVDGGVRFADSFVCELLARDGRALLTHEYRLSRSV